jgi:hypothetical protein
LTTGAGGGRADPIRTAGGDGAKTRRTTGRHGRPMETAARTGTGSGRDELAVVVVTSRRPVGTETLKPALIPC